MAGTRRRFRPTGGASGRSSRPTRIAAVGAGAANAGGDGGAGPGGGSHDERPAPSREAASLPPLTSPSAGPVGHVRATPPGHGLSSARDDPSSVRSWRSVRDRPSRSGSFPLEGFGHVLGGEEIRAVDGLPVGGRVVGIDGPYPVRSRRGAGGRGRDDGLDADEEEAVRAELEARRALLAEDEAATDPTSGRRGDGESDGRRDRAAGDGHEYGAPRTPLDAPVGSLRDKWRLVPHFLRLRGLMKQHIDSYDHFIGVEMKQIVQVSYG